jgi:hypothetical protein
LDCCHLGSETPKYVRDLEAKEGRKHEAAHLTGRGFIVDAPLPDFDYRQVFCSEAGLAMKNPGDKYCKRSIYGNGISIISLLSSTQLRPPYIN